MLEVVTVRIVTGSANASSRERVKERAEEIPLTVSWTPPQSQSTLPLSLSSSVAPSKADSFLLHYL